jgi:hypothetical protein
MSCGRHFISTHGGGNRDAREYWTANQLDCANAPVQSKLECQR